MTRWPLLLALAAATTTVACGGHQSDTDLAPVRGASPAQVDSTWNEVKAALRHAKWNKMLELLPPLMIQMNPTDPRIPMARYYLGEAKLGHGDHLEAVREFRRVVDDLSDAPIAPEALLRVGDTYTSMWRRPELDPTYGEQALAAYEELAARFPGSRAAARAQRKIADLNEHFAYKAFHNAMYYVRIKAYDSAILYLRDLIATYPRATIVPQALGRLLESYRKLGYQEDVQETCSYARKYHADAPALLARCEGVAEPAAPASDPAGS